MQAVNENHYSKSRSVTFDTSFERNTASIGLTRFEDTVRELFDHPTHIYQTSSIELKQALSKDRRVLHWGERYSCLNTPENVEMMVMQQLQEIPRSEFHAQTFDKILKNKYSWEDIDKMWDKLASNRRLELGCRENKEFYRLRDARSYYSNGNSSGGNLNGSNSVARSGVAITRNEIDYGYSTGNVNDQSWTIDRQPQRVGNNNFTQPNRSINQDELHFQEILDELYENPKKVLSVSKLGKAVQAMLEKSPEVIYHITYGCCLSSFDALTNFVTSILYNHGVPTKFRLTVSKKFVKKVTNGKGIDVNSWWSTISRREWFELDEKGNLMMRQIITNSTNDQSTNYGENDGRQLDNSHESKSRKRRFNDVYGYDSQENTNSNPSKRVSTEEIIRTNRYYQEDSLRDPFASPETAPLTTYADLTRTTNTLTVFNSTKTPMVQSYEEYFEAPLATLDQITGTNAAFVQGATLATEEIAIQQFRESGLLGYCDVHNNCEDAPSNIPVHLNLNDPFCVVAVGVQGAGKSHTVNCILESCLIPFEENDVIRLQRPMTALALHYHPSPSAICEVTGLIEPHPSVRGLPHPPALPRERMIVLVSPTYYKQRKAFYGNYCTVRPLLFHWNQLSADHIRRIMNLHASDSQLYIASMFNLLRGWQRDDRLPSFDQFCRAVEKICRLPGQMGSLEQRLNLIKTVIAESPQNRGIQGIDLISACKPGILVVVDLTDPLLSKDDANGIFQVLVEQFRALPTIDHPGKILLLDEAHKYMDGNKTSDGLSGALVNVVRAMRHEAMRVVVSTQSPLALREEFLELVSTLIMHRFQSSDWFRYLQKKVILPDNFMQTISNLKSGHSVVFSPMHQLHQEVKFFEGSDKVFPMIIRRRLTADRGVSILNTVDDYLLEDNYGEDQQSLGNASVESIV